MTNQTVLRSLMACALVVTTGCSSTGYHTVATQIPEQRHTPAAKIEIPADENQENGQDVTVASTDEEAVLSQIIERYESAVQARKDGNYTGAETCIEEALILTQDIEIDAITDEALLSRIKDTLTAVAQESGRLFREASVIAEEDPLSWLEEVDAEKFRSGQWTDAELEKIVQKIALKSDIPIEFNQEVRNAIYFFQNGRRKEMTNWIKRSGRWIPMMHQILEEEGMPRDLVYLSMIESGFNPRAYSSARAMGLWQFIYATGKTYGLDRDQWIDERRDPEKATRAAARHLKDLYKISDDWNIVMAAYNAGPGRVTPQLAKTENLEYWDMQLPAETRSYVPFFMAATVISKEPALFGFDIGELEPPFDYDTAEVHPYMSLRDAATCAGTTIEVMRDLNPELLQDRVPPGKEPYTLRIPVKSRDMFMLAYSQIPEEKYAAPKIAEHVYVRRGDSFSSIANRLKVSTSELKAANPQIKNINRLSVGQRITVPGNGSAPVETANTRESTTSTASTSSSSQVASRVTPTTRAASTRYTVKANDTLGSIATKNGTTIRAIQSLNNMGSSTKIIVGQRLLIPSGGSATTSSRTTSGSQRITYVVKSNDTVISIAERHGVDYRDIIRDNKLNAQGRITPGQKLTIAK